jgi:hypothetical protein
LYGESANPEAHGRRSDCCYASFSEQSDARRDRKLTKLRTFRAIRIATCIAVTTTIRRS